MNAVNPPDTSAAYPPFAFIVATSARPPGMKVIRSASTRAITPASRPVSNASRAFSAPSKSSSPFIARAVIAATSAPTPAMSASSSMHSCRIIVESMSASSIRFRRPAAGWTTMSTPIPCNAAHVSHRPSGTAATANSAASSGASHTASPPPQAFRSDRTSAGSSDGAAGEVRSVTMNMRRA